MSTLFPVRFGSYLLAATPAAFALVVFGKLVGSFGVPLALPASAALLAALRHRCEHYSDRYKSG